MRLPRRLQIGHDKRCHPGVCYVPKGQSRPLYGCKREFNGTMDAGVHGRPRTGPERTGFHPCQPSLSRQQALPGFPQVRCGSCTRKSLGRFEGTNARCRGIWAQPRLRSRSSLRSPTDELSQIVPSCDSSIAEMFTGDVTPPDL